jgi:predicted HD superfamily hydrolase involved in NAD metabolism
MTINLQEILHKYLNSEERIHHSIRVADLAVELAKKYEVEPHKAYTAGILHDLAKEITFEKAIQLSREHNYSLSESELLNKKLLHAPIGALIAQYELGITDTEVISSIRWHTTGKANMSTLEKIIYLSDMAEPGRKYPEANEIKEFSFQDLNKAMHFAIKHSLKKLIDAERNIDSHSIDCYNYLTKS